MLTISIMERLEPGTECTLGFKNPSLSFLLPFLRSAQTMVNPQKENTWKALFPLLACVPQNGSQLLCGL